MSSSDTSTAVKSCCACGADVTGLPRMKDSHGKYWCMTCGQADQKRKLTAATHLPCAGCRKPFPKGKLDKHGDHFFCKPCLKKRTKVATASSPSFAGASAPAATPALAARATLSGGGGGGGAVASHPAGDRRRVILMAAVLATLIVLALLFNFAFAE